MKDETKYTVTTTEGTTWLHETHIEVARRIACQISCYDPARQNEMLFNIISEVKANRENQLKEIHDRERHTKESFAELHTLLEKIIQP